MWESSDVYAFHEEGVESFDALDEFINDASSTSPHELGDDCCLSEDDKIDRLFEKIENCTEISKLEPGSRRPTLIAGTGSCQSY